MRVISIMAEPGFYCKGCQAVVPIMFSIDYFLLIFKKTVFNKIRKNSKFENTANIFKDNTFSEFCNSS